MLLDKSEIARQLAAMRPALQLTCPVCGSPMQGISLRRYCSNACRMKAYRQRRALKAQPANGSKPAEG